MNRSYGQKLSMNLRNALLTSLTLSQIDTNQLIIGPEKRIHTLSLLKNSIEHCRFYLDKISSETFDGNGGKDVEKNTDVCDVVRTLAGKYMEVFKSYLKNLATLQELGLMKL